MQEDESLGIAWGLEQTKYFTLGCDDLLIVTDHKPLVKIFGDRTLDEIPNSRLFRLKQRTLPWRFEIEHMPGTSKAADATSRHPSSSEYGNTASIDLLSDEDHLEMSFVSGISHDFSQLTSMSWNNIAAETKSDSILNALSSQLLSGFPQKVMELDSILHPFWNMKESLYIGEGGVVVWRKSSNPQKSA